MKTEKIRGLVGLARRARSVTIGSRETRAGLRRGEVRLVLLASDGSSRDRERVTRIALELSVPARTVGSREELGAWVGSAPVAVVGLQDPHLAAAVRDGVDEAERAPERPKARGGETK